MIHKRIISISKHDLLSDLIPRQEGRASEVRILRNHNSAIPVAFTIKIHPNTTEFFKSSLFLLRKSFCCSSLKIVFFFFSVWTDPYFKAHEALTWNDFFPTLGWRPTHLGDFHLVSICTTLDCIQFNCSHTFSLDSLQKNFCVVLLLSFIAANLHATPLTSQSINTRAKSTCWATCWSEIWSSGAVRDNQMRMDIRYGWLCGMILLRESCFEVKVEYLLYYCQM